MALHFILGRAGSGKTRYCLDLARRAAAADPDGPPLILLVPEQATHQTERALLAVAGAPSATTRVSVLSFRRLAMRVLEATGGAALPMLDKLGRQMLLASIVEGRREELTVFRGSARRPGFVKRLGATFGEFAAQRIGAADLTLCAAGLTAAGNRDEMLSGKLLDLAQLLADYQAAIQDVYLDPHSALDLAAVRLAAAQSMLGATVFVDGFAGFTAQEHELLAALLEAAADVHVALCLDPAAVLAAGASSPARDAPGLFAPTLKTYWRLRSMAAARRVRVGDPVCLPFTAQPVRFVAPALNFVETAWDRQAPAEAGQGPPPPAGALRLVRAADERHEVAAAAAEMRRLASERGYAWRDMALLVPDLEAYHDLLRVVFAEFGIPLFVDRRRPVPYHPLVELLRSTVEIALTNWAPAPVSRWLKTDLGPLTRAEADLLENFILANGVRGRRWTDDDPWRDSVPQLVAPGVGDPAAAAPLAEEPELAGEDADLPPGRSSAPTCDALRRKVVAALAPSVASLRRAITTPAAVSGLVRTIVDLLAVLGLPGVVEGWAAEARRAGDQDAAQEHRVVWDGVVRVLEQLHAALGPARMRLDEFAAVLAAGLESLDLGLIPPSLDQVVCGTVERSRQPVLKAMFVLGAKFGALPGAPAEDLVFSDAERLRLSDTAQTAHPIELAAPANERAFHEDYLTYIAVTRASDYLWLSYPQRSGGTAANTPSPAIDRLQRLFPGLPLSIADETELAATPAALAREAVGHLAGVKHGLPLPERWAQVYSWLVADAGRRAALRKAFAGLSWTNAPKPLRPAQSAALLGRPIRGSATRLEQYGRCPFAHYAGRALKLEVRGQRRVEAPDIGHFYHALLQSYFGGLGRSGVALADLDDAALDESLDKLFASVAGQLERAVWGDTSQLRHLVRMLQRTLRRTVRQLRLHERRSHLTPLGMEIGFGLPGSPRPALDLGPLILRGVIDRLDGVVRGDELLLRIVDYKSGRPTFSLARVLHGISLQLPLYLAAIGEFISALAKQAGLTGAERGDLVVVVAALLLFPVQDPMVVLDDWDEAEMAKKLAAKWRPSGLVLGEPEALLLLDEAAAGDAAQRLLGVRLTKAGEVSGKDAVSRGQLELLARFAVAIARSTAERLQAGDTSLRPFRDGLDRACKWCDYHAVCAFDPQLPGNRYNDLPKLAAAEIWQQIESIVMAAEGGGGR